MKGRISSEEQCLCFLLKKALTEEQMEQRDEVLLGQAEIDGMLQLARGHKVLALLYDLLHGRELLTSKQDEVLSQCAEQTTMQSYRLLFLTRQVVSLLENQGIPTLVLKGCAIAGYYPVPEYRKAGDVDLLLSDEEALEKACRVLEAQGYSVKEEQHANHHRVLVGDWAIDIELHTLMAEPFDNDRLNRLMSGYCHQSFSERARVCSMGMEFPTAPGYLFAYSLLVHMLQHYLRAGFGLKLLADWVVFWRNSRDKTVIGAYLKLVQESGLMGFSKAVTLVCETYLGLPRGIVHGEGLDREFSEGYGERFLKDVLEAEEFGRSDNRRMVALRKKSLGGYLKEFHYQMKLSYPRESRRVICWPVLWGKTFMTFWKNNRRLGRGPMLAILKNAGERAGLVEELRLYKN